MISFPEAVCYYCDRVIPVKDGVFERHVGRRAELGECIGALRRPSECPGDSPCAGPFEFVMVRTSFVAVGVPALNLPKELTASTGDHMAVVHRRITLLDDGSPLIEYIEDRK